MEPFVSILYIHVIATLALAGAISVELLVLRQLRQTPGGAEANNALNLLPGLQFVASISLLVLLLSGGYLAGQASFWKSAWPKIAVILVIVFGALAGISNRRLRKIRQLCSHGQILDSEVTQRIRAPFLKLSLSVRMGLLLAIVLLMTAKPSLYSSLEIVLAFFIISCASASLQFRVQARQIKTTGPELDRPAR